eukprot:6386058-Amphidinium_carterae.1
MGREIPVETPCRCAAGFSEELDDNRDGVVSTLEMVHRSVLMVGRIICCIVISEVMRSLMKACTPVAKAQSCSWLLSWVELLTFQVSQYQHCFEARLPVMQPARQ